ncbi:MAG: hypothetical protein FE78DRAFT_34776 [Acidomyces sp. 'richmondensis']|nr:MAG: hypothetical protein FE78DRAFT_34776 [Acidomyces sp. 'richmondensis']
MASKIVIVGNVNGKTTELFTRLAALHTKNNFSFAIIAGNLFAEGEKEEEEVTKLLNGEIVIPLPIYFAIGNQALPRKIIERLEAQDGEICPNLTTFGHCGSLKTTEGFQVVFLGGVYSTGSDGLANRFAATYSDQDIEVITKNLSHADILVTSEWPKLITERSEVRYPGPLVHTTADLADLCTTLKPRYHFSTSEFFYEREPYFHSGPMPRHITRFISLAPYGNTEKQKSIYAFNLVPNEGPPTQLPANTTASPFIGNKKRKLANTEGAEFGNFRYATGNLNGSHEPSRGWGLKKRQRHQPLPHPSECYFCLSNKNCETHMIGSIGNEVYLTIAKGPLTTRKQFTCLGFPGHVLLIPFQHTPTISAIADPEARQATFAELNRYRNALQTMLVERSKSAEGRAQLGAVTWEISRRDGIHNHWQFLPIAVDKILNGLVEQAFKTEAENLHYPLFIEGYENMKKVQEDDFFKVIIWSETFSKEMVLPLDKSFRFDLQFPRKVLAMLLEIEERTNWKDCAQTKEEEAADAEVFKELFKPFDFSLE